MSPSSLACWLAALPALAAGAAVAQTTPHSASAKPNGAPPALTYRSALDGYRPFTDDQPVPWKEANDTVHLRGGWRASAKEAQSAGDTAPPSHEADPHAGHAMPVHKGHP
jgi:hypothetical protein